MMRPANTASVWSLWFDRANLVLAALGCVFLLLTLVLVFIGVFLRYAISLPILGLNEIIQLSSIGVVMLALPSCTAQEGHVRVDVLDQMIGRVGRFIGDLLSRALSAFVLSVLVGRAWLKMLDAREFGDTTNMLGIPLWPFYAFVAAGMALCVVVLAVQFVMIIFGKGRP
ncbi:TRAP transporter small permease [Thioclava kandeliae]|uniref:TRAP transporter small permease protein n=1 Tax=Thioclava kandeliae TaxID=3070818 RepID=A0ABV1SMR9_9RHOB